MKALSGILFFMLQAASVYANTGHTLNYQQSTTTCALSEKNWQTQARQLLDTLLIQRTGSHAIIHDTALSTYLSKHPIESIVDHYFYTDVDTNPPDVSCQKLTVQFIPQSIEALTHALEYFAPLPEQRNHTTVCIAFSPRIRNHAAFIDLSTNIMQSLTQHNTERQARLIFDTSETCASNTAQPVETISWDMDENETHASWSSNHHTTKTFSGTSIETVSQTATDALSQYAMQKQYQALLASQTDTSITLRIAGIQNTQMLTKAMHLLQKTPGMQHLTITHVHDDVVELRGIYTRSDNARKHFANHPAFPLLENPSQPLNQHSLLWKA